ncbi:hypothetical protein [Roseibium sp.]|uniref:hypothetical protein n=1 Tax=Roseibium sp. TaxID=1936156 RepID=UPI0025EBCCA8|nr:hypothetical protein [Roseibium sp.]
MISISTTHLSRSTSRTRAKLLSTSAVLVLISGSAFAEDTGKAALDAYLDGLKSLGVEMKNGSVDYDAASDTLTLSDSILSISGSIKHEAAKSESADAADDAAPAEPKELTYSFSIASETVTISGLTHDNNTFSVASWVYSDDTKLIATGAATSEGRFQAEGRMSGISVTNYSFDMPEIPAEDKARQASRWLPFARSLVQASYEEARIDNTGLTFEAYVTDGDGEKLIASGTGQMDGYLISDVVDGKVGEYSIDRLVQDIELHDADSGETMKQTTSQGKTIYKNLDYGALLDLFDPSVPASDEERTLLGSASSIDYVTTQEVAPGVMVEAKVDRTSIDEVTLIKRENNLLSILDDALAEKEPAPEEIITSVFQFYRSLGVADSRASGISLSIPNPGIDEDISINIKEIAMTDVSSEGLGEMMIVGLDTPALPEGASVKLDWAAIGDIEFADYTPMRAMIATLMADPDYGENHPIEVARAFMPRSMAYEVEGLDVNVPDLGRTVIGKAEMNISTTVPPIPTSFYLKNDGIEFPVSAIEDKEAQEILSVLGLEKVVWSDETRLYWDEATLELHLERLMLDIQGVGRAEMSARFANVPKALFEDPEGQGQMAAIVAQFVDASLVFNDDGLTAKGVAHIAEQEGIPENVFREALVAQAAQATAPIQNEAFTQMVSDAVSTFLKDPKQLKVTLTPANPVPLAQILGSMAAPQTLPDLLAVKIEAN